MEPRADTWPREHRWTLSIRRPAAGSVPRTEASEPVEEEEVEEEEGDGDAASRRGAVPRKIKTPTVFIFSSSSFFFLEGWDPCVADEATVRDAHWIPPSLPAANNSSSSSGGLTSPGCGE